MYESEMISLMSHTLGSIGEVFKCKKLANNLSFDKALDEIERIYNGYIEKVTQIHE